MALAVGQGPWFTAEDTSRAKREFGSSRLHAQGLATSMPPLFFFPSINPEKLLSSAPPV